MSRISDGAILFVIFALGVLAVGFGLLYIAGGIK
jgi:hypothetical protein